MSHRRNFFKCFDVISTKNRERGRGESWVTIHSEKNIFHIPQFRFSYFTLINTVSCLNCYLLRPGGIDVLLAEICEEIDMFNHRSSILRRNLPQSELTRTI